jgi:hypothetical protein
MNSVSLERRQRRLAFAQHAMHALLYANYAVAGLNDMESAAAKPDGRMRLPGMYLVIFF